MLLLLYNSNGKRHGRVLTISGNGKTEKTKKKQIFSDVVTAQNYSVFIFVISRRCRGRSFIVFLWEVDIDYMRRWRLCVQSNIVTWWRWATVHHVHRSTISLQKVIKRNCDFLSVCVRTSNRIVNEEECRRAERQKMGDEEEERRRKRERSMWMWNH